MADGVEDILDSLEGMRRTAGVIGYGSLIHPDELDEAFAGPNPLSAPFRLQGYKRVFNNRSAWRAPEGTRSAVLNVEPDPERWCNVVLIVFRSETQREKYETREKGYRLERVSPDQLTPYIGSHRRVLDAVDRIQIPIGDRVESDIEPIPDYVDTCLEGARRWDDELEKRGATESGRRFSEDFVRTTELADGTPLAEYLAARSIDNR